MKKIQVLLVDDHSVVRMGLAAIINLERDLHVCGEAENGQEAVAQAKALRPDVIVMDLMMPGMSGAETTQAALAVSPETKILVLTTFGTSVEIAAALDAGAVGAVTKNLSNADLADAIRKTAAGERVLSPEIAAALKENEAAAQFSPRQMEIIDSITRGLSNQEIATLLGISRTRVKQHLTEVFEKLGAANRAEVAALAMRRNLLKI